MRVGLDVMGGDFAPQATLEGAILAHKNFLKDEDIVLFGDQKIITQGLQSLGGNPDDFIIVHADEVIGMGEHPTKAFKSKPESSIVKGFMALKNKSVDTFASAGNTGAMLVGSVYVIGTVPGVSRPATSAIFPRVTGGNNIILDVGTNVDTKPENLLEFAILGKIYAENLYQIQNPKIGLLNIGAEKEKGNTTTKTAYPLLEEAKALNFIGNIEGRDLLTDQADVIVCDGFTGNVALKQGEAFYHIMMKRGIHDEYLDRFNYENFGGTPILGANAPVVVGHGISNGKAIMNMLLHSRDMYKADLPAKIEYSVRKNLKNK